MHIMINRDKIKSCHGLDDHEFVNKSCQGQASLPHSPLPNSRIPFNSCHNSQVGDFDGHFSEGVADVSTSLGSVHFGSIKPLHLLH